MEYDVRYVFLCACCPVVAQPVLDGSVDDFIEHVIDGSLIVRIGNLARLGDEILRLSLRGHGALLYVTQIRYIILHDRMVSCVFR